MVQMDKNNAFNYPSEICEPITGISVFLHAVDSR